ncbi:MAG TPA: ABC transporter permease, partial [Verrucomicrobiae bacterium]|nr:ABC transporter permease [Verrucomicrobiae bacterium]
MLLVLLAKDLRRAWRNPLPWLINLALPLCMTALIGLAFGDKSDTGALGRIRFAVVDEDDSVLTGFLRGAANQRESGKYLEPVFLQRAAALRQINDNKLSAVLIIPTNFTRNYVTGGEAVSLELIKNPAESIHPAVLEELLGAVVTALSAISRNFQSEFPEWREVIEGKRDYHQVSALIERAGDKLKTAGKYVNPPLVSYERVTRTSESRTEAPRPVGSKGEAKGSGSKSAPAFNLFAYLLAGMAGMFLLFLANNGMNDLHRELRQRTFERYHTLHQRLFPFIASKVVFTVVLLLFSSVVMLGGGAVIFRIHWQQPLALAALTLGYSAFAAGTMALLVSLMPDERRGTALNTIAAMALGIMGGCAFPPQNLPAFLREHVSPLLPSYWFADTVRRLNFGDENVP